MKYDCARIDKRASCMARFVNFEYSSFVVLWEVGGCGVDDGVGNVYSLIATFFVTALPSLPMYNYIC